VTLGVAIVGCGLIGTKRAQALAGQRLVVCADLERARAERLAGVHGAQAASSWADAVERKDVDIVIVATTNDALVPLALAAIERGKHVLVEKPAARTAAEVSRVIEAARNARVLVRVGFNHRYHPALLKALALVRDGAVGELMFLRGRYGHGGRPGYDREWRADPQRAGGGELMDQGVHMIDLARCFLGEFDDVRGFAPTYYWDMPVDDNAFMLLRTRDGRAAFLHVSCTEWKNLFSLEVYGRSGKLQVDGLGGSYGVERLTYYRMLPEMGPPETTAWEYPMGDRSWAVEFEEFVDDIRMRREPAAGLEDARRALEVVERIYAQTRDDHR
jgi:predicted dehydrogenase